MGDPDAANFGELVFDESFDNPTGWSLLLGDRTEAIGNPAPAVQFFSSSGRRVERLVPVTYANRSLVFSADVMVVFDPDTNGDAFVRVGLMTYHVNRTNGVVTSTIDPASGHGETVIPNADGWRSMRIRIDSTGTHYEVGGASVLANPLTSITTDQYLLVLQGFRQRTPKTSAATEYIDNVRLYRGN